MLSDIFYWLLNCSIIGSFVGLLVLLLRKIKKLPRFVVYVLWLLPLFRLWLPFGIPNQFSLLHLLSRFTTKTVILRQNLPELTMTNALMVANSYFPIEYRTDLLENVFSTASVIWSIVCLAGILTAAFFYFFTKSELKSAEPVRDNLYQSDKITVPAVYGIFRPRIIIPAAISGMALDYILLHEMTHIRRRDNLFRVIAVITACLHWFNPLVWIFLKAFFADMELACDAKVLKELNEDQSREYARAVLACASGKSFFASSFGGTRTKIRIENILSYRKLTGLSSLFFTLFVLAIAFVIVTNAAG